jgi:hypothetical protein
MEDLTTGWLRPSAGACRVGHRVRHVDPELVLVQRQVPVAEAAAFAVAH